MKKGRKQSISKIITILILMSAFLVGCKEDTPASTTVEDTLDISDEFLADNMEEDTDSTIDKDSANEFTDGSESTVEDSDKDTSTSNTDESTEDNNNNESTEEKDNKESTENSTSESTKEPEGNTSSEVTPPVVEEPVTPPPAATTVPSVSWSGTGVTLSSLNITIPTLKDFNDEALTDNTNNTHWYGNTNDTATGQVLADTLNSVASAIISTGVIGENAQTFAVEQYRISWSWTSFSSTMDYSLRRDPLTQTYTLELNLPFDSYVSSFGVDVTSYNQDIIRTLISCFSSNVNEVYSKLYQDVYGDVCISDTGWTTVGDCKMQYDDANSSLNHFVYKIKAN